MMTVFEYTAGTMLTVISFKWFVAYLPLVDVVSPEQLPMELCVTDDDDDDGVFGMGVDGCTPPKSAVSSGFAFNTECSH